MNYRPKPKWIEAMAALPGIWIIILIIGFGAIAYNKVDTLSGRVDKIDTSQTAILVLAGKVDTMSKSVDVLASVVASLPVQSQRISDLEQASRELKAREDKQADAFNQLVNNTSVDHATLERIRKTVDDANADRLMGARK